MSVPEHNPKLPRPEDVIQIVPENILFDSVKRIQLGRGKAYWQPDDRFFAPPMGGNEAILLQSIAPEAFFQFAGYIAAHGLEEPRTPFLTGADDIWWKKVVRPGDTLGIEVEVHPSPSKVLKASGALTREGEVVCAGKVQGILYDRSLDGHLSRVSYLDRNELEKTEGKYSAQHLTDTRETDTEQIIPANLVIIDERHIELDGHRIKVSKIGRHILDSLVAAGEAAITAKGIYESPDFPSDATFSGRQSLFSREKRELLEQIVAEDGRSLIIQTTGRQGRQYFRLNQGVKVTQPEE